MNIFSGVLFGLVGLSAGPVVNALADRLPVVELDWRCPSCQSPRWPWALAELALGRRACPQCRWPYTLRAPTVELVAAASLGCAGLIYGMSARGLLAAFYLSVLILATVTDLERRLIYNKAMMPALAVALLAGFASPWMTWQQALLGGAVNLAFFYTAALLARGGIGGGDVKLATFIGLSTGFPASIAAMTIGVLLGGLVSAILFLLRRVNLKTMLPYGPFLAVGGAIVLMWK